MGSKCPVNIFLNLGNSLVSKKCVHLGWEWEKGVDLYERRVQMNVPHLFILTPS